MACQTQDVFESPRDNANLMPTRHGEVTGVLAEKIQKIKINKPAIVQDLKVDHVLSYLIEKNVLTEEDKKLIKTPLTGQNKARKLIELLPSNGANVDWYSHFRYALQHPDCRNNEVKKKYRILVEFLDNSILPSQYKDKRRLPHYDALPEISPQSPQSTMKTSSSDIHYSLSTDTQEPETGESRSVSGVEEKGTEDGRMVENVDKDETTQVTQAEYKPNTNRTLLKGYFQKWVTAPDDYVSIISEPKELFRQLEDSTDKDDKEQLEQEKTALDCIRKLEIVLILSHQGKLPEGFEVCMSSAAEELLSNTNLYHFYFKYFQQVCMQYNLDIPLELAVSFVNVINMLEDSNDGDIRQHAVKLGFGLFDLLSQYGMYERAQTVIYSLVTYLAKNNDIESWMVTWEALIKLMGIFNLNNNFMQTDAIHNCVSQVASKIKLMCFGKDLLDESLLFTELSIMMREQGSVTPAYMWAQDALKEVEPDNHEGIVAVLCHAVPAYSNKFMVKKAEDLAIHAIRYAKKFFGTRHPLYIQALLSYCQYSSEFRQDEMGVDVARRAVEICEKIYSDGISIQKANAHQALARALVVSHHFTDDEYLEQAMIAWRVALDVLPGSHPKLAIFRFTLAQCLFWKASFESKERALGTLIWGETEASGALTTFKAFWGQYSPKAARATALLGQIYAKMDNPEEAKEQLMANLDLHNVAFAPNSIGTYLAHASLGTFYKSVDKPLEALDNLKAVVDNIDCGGVYLAWVHICFDTVIEIFKSINREKDADIYQAALIDWMKKNPKPSHCLTWDMLDTEPVSYDQYYEHFDAFRVKLKAHKKGLKNLRLNLKV